MSASDSATALEKATVHDLEDTTAMVVGASRGLGLAIATSFADAGATTVAVSRTASTPDERIAATDLRAELADATDPTVAAELIDRYQPRILVLVAGAHPHMRPLQHQTWDTFSAHWHTDVRITFQWLREALLTPLRPGGKVIVISSGAANNPKGSPLSGGYAGAKVTQRLITSYAQEEADLAGLNLTFSAVLPGFAPATAVGRAAVNAYATRAGVTGEDFLKASPLVTTPEVAGTAITALATTDAREIAPAYLLTGEGLHALP